MKLQKIWIFGLVFSSFLSSLSYAKPLSIGDIKYIGNVPGYEDVKVKVVGFEDGNNVRVEELRKSDNPAFKPHPLRLSSDTLFDTPNYMPFAQPKEALLLVKSDVETSLGCFDTIESIDPVMWLGSSRDGLAKVVEAAGYEEDGEFMELSKNVKERVSSYDDGDQLFEPGSFVIYYSKKAKGKVGAIIQRVFADGVFEVQPLFQKNLAYRLVEEVELAIEVAQYKRFNFSTLRFETFQIGSRVEHPRLGRGTVRKLFDEGRAYVEYDLDSPGELKKNSYPLIRRLKLLSMK